jgi:hypothetical protein
LVDGVAWHPVPLSDEERKLAKQQAANKKDAQDKETD